MKIALVALAATLVVATAAQAQENNATINQRKYDQQQRIGQGVRSGQMTPGEASRVEHQERAMNREERNMRAVNGGRLTRGDRAVLQHQQNRVSRHIYRTKHNARVY